MRCMWLAPFLYAAVSVFLWKYGGAVFVPRLMARSALAWIPSALDMETVIIVNMALLYFGAYFVFAMYWEKIQPYLKHPTMAALVLWLVNVLVVFPLVGRGVLGYRLPQGWVSASLPLLVSHWLFARGLQFQERKTR